jgi:2-oxoglutarate dehydrogenase E2 component (dihydrolipoamide succinyltransferase)
MTPEPIAVRVPRLNVNDDQVKIVSWLVASGDRVEKRQPLVVVETSKTTLEVEAPEAGVVHWSRQADEEVPVGDVLCSITPAAASERETAASPPPDQGPARADQKIAPMTESAPESAPGPVPARLSARARARIEALGLSPERFAGQGLVREEDVLRLVQGLSSLPGSGGVTAPAAPGPAEAKPAEGVAVRFEPLPRQKIVEAKFLASTYFQALSSSVTVSCPTRGLRRAAAQQASMRGDVTALILFETARLLRRFPVFNAFCQGHQVGYYEKVNVGLAVDAGRGLKVLVVRDADKKPFPTIAAEVRESIVQYLEDRLPVETLSGGTFTVTDLSGEGALSFFPLINQGQSAILGVGGEVVGPWANQGAFNLMLTFDHRLSEGRTAAQFLNALRERLSCHEAALGTAGRRNGAGVDCHRCLRSAEQLEALDGFLLPCAHPQGHVCSFCLAGY